jgi:hypothetical protein
MPEYPNDDSTPRHHPGSRKGEEQKHNDGPEPGRVDNGGSHGANRPAGGRTGRDSTSINPEDREPIDPDSPEIPPA